MIKKKQTKQLHLI